MYTNVMICIRQTPLLAVMNVRDICPVTPLVLCDLRQRILAVSLSNSIALQAASATQSACFRSCFCKCNFEYNIRHGSIHTTAAATVLAWVAALRPNSGRGNPLLAFLQGHPTVLGQNGPSKTVFLLSFGTVPALATEQSLMCSADAFCSLGSKASHKWFPALPAAGLNPSHFATLNDVQWKRHILWCRRLMPMGLACCRALC